MTTMWPMCKSDPDGSIPSLMLSFFPEFNFSSRSFLTIMSTTPLFNKDFGFIFFCNFFIQRLTKLAFIGKLELSLITS